MTGGKASDHFHARVRSEVARRAGAACTIGSGEVATTNTHSTHSIHKPQHPQQATTRPPLSRAVSSPTKQASHRGALWPARVRLFIFLRCLTGCTSTCWAPYQVMSSRDYREDSRPYREDSRSYESSSRSYESSSRSTYESSSTSTGSYKTSGSTTYQGSGRPRNSDYTAGGKLRR